MSTLDTKDVLITNERRSGNTTRLCDKAIQMLFNGDICVVRDAHRNGECSVANRFLFRKVLQRLFNEHPHIEYVADSRKFEVYLKGSD